MKILITGGQGQTAFELIQLAKRNNDSYLAPSHLELDITNEQSIVHCLERFSPDCVINTAAYTAVDQAEDNPALAHAVNCLGARNLAAACAKHECFLIHLSTDYVFDGLQSRPYFETDSASPLNIYGQSKWQGEQMIQKHCEKYIILRTSAVFGRHGHNFVKTLIKLAQTKEELKVIYDQVTAPTAASDIARAVFNIIQKPHFYGIFNYCGDEAVSWYEFANRIITLIPEPKVKRVLPVKAEDYAARAKRPAFSVLNCHKIKEKYGIIPSDWNNKLNEVVKCVMY